MPTLMEKQLNAASLPNKIRTTILMNMLLTVALATIEITPYLSRNFSLTFNFIIFLLWMLSAVIANNTKVKLTLNNKVALWSIIWWSWQVIMLVVGHSNLLWKIYIDRITLYAIPIMMTFIISKYNFREKKILAKSMFVMIIINVISNVILGIKDPGVFTYLNYVDLGYNARLTNAGSTDFVCVCMFFAVICLLLFINTNKMFSKLLYIVIIVFSSYFIVVENPRAIAFIMLLLLAFGLLIVPHRKIKNTDKAMRVLGFCLLLLAILAFLLPFLRWISSLFTSSTMSSKINYIIRVLEGDFSFLSSREGSFALRFQLTKTSISTLFSSISNFLIGVGERVHGTSFDELIQSGVGGHSELIDCLAEYGIIGGFIVYKFLSEIIKKIYSLSSSPIIQREIKVIIAVFVLYSFLNNSFIENIFYVVFMLLPILIVLLDYQEDKKRHILEV